MITNLIPVIQSASCTHTVQTETHNDGQTARQTKKTATNKTEETNRPQKNYRQDKQTGLGAISGTNCAYKNAFAFLTFPTSVAYMMQGFDDSWQHNSYLYKRLARRENICTLYHMNQISHKILLLVAAPQHSFSRKQILHSTDASQTCQCYAYTKQRSKGLRIYGEVAHNAIILL